MGVEVRSTGVPVTAGRRGIARVFLLGAVLAVAVLSTGATSAAAAGCPNEAIREAQGSTFLPECRAYELVSPAAQAPAYIPGEPFLHPVPAVGRMLASESGERVAYTANYPNAGDASDGEFFLATRDAEADDWSVTNVVPPQSTGSQEDTICYPIVYFSSALTSDVLEDGFDFSQELAAGVDVPGHPCARDEPDLVPGEPEGGVSNLFLENDESGSAQLVNVTPSGVTPENAVLEGVSTSLDHVLFGEEAQLVAGAPSGFDLYEWSEGALGLVTYTPEGQPVEGKLAGGVSPVVANGHVVGLASTTGPVTAVTHSVSTNGERVFFTADGGLFLRENSSRAPTPSGSCEPSDPTGACTVEVDADEGGSGTSGGGEFLYASTDGGRAFFLDQQRLTPDATAGSGKPDLYEYDAEAPEGERLTDLTANTSEPADVLGYSGAAEDGSYLYFVADGVLAGANRDGLAPRKKLPNLYVVHNREPPTFIAALSAASDDGAWAADAAEVDLLDTAVSPDGEYIGFNSIEPLTGYDNEPAEADLCRSAARCPEVFLYSASEGVLACASCNPDGAPPTGPSGLRGESFTGATGTPEYPARRVFDDGQLFFESADGLVSAQTNGVPEVYEYRSGQVELISSGKGKGSVLGEVSANAENVFLISSQALVGADTGATPSLYDARVDGGFAESAARKECEGEKCLGPLTEGPSGAIVGTTSFDGPGNFGPLPAKKTTKLTRSQELQRALKLCRKKSGKGRRTCEATAHKRFGAKPKKGEKAKKSPKGHASGSRRTSRKGVRR